MVACKRTRNQIARLPLSLRDAGRGKFPAPLIFTSREPRFWGWGWGENLSKDKRESECSLISLGWWGPGGCCSMLGVPSLPFVGFRAPPRIPKGLGVPWVLQNLPKKLMGVPRAWTPVRSERSQEWDSQPEPRYRVGTGIPVSPPGQ